MVEDEINLIDYWRILKKGRRFILLTVTLVTMLSILISLALTKTYKSEAVIMPLGGQKGGGGMMAAVSQMGLGGLLGGIGGTSSNTSQILAILKSRTLAEKVIEKCQLMPSLFEGEWDFSARRWKSQDPGQIPNVEEAVRRLKLILSFLDDKKNQTISIAAEMKDSQKAADVVNGYLTELSTHIHVNTFTEAKRNRIFVESQLERNKVELLEAGKELSSFYSTNRISNAVPMVDVDVSVGDPKTEELRTKVEDLNRKISQVQVVHEVPQQVYLQYLTLRQELLGKMNALLTQQYEMAKIDEAKEDLTFQVIDPARVPIRKYKPKRAQIVVTAFVMSIFLSIFFVFFREYLQKMKEAEGRSC